MQERQILVNGETYGIHRGKINENFLELWTVSLSPDDVLTRGNTSPYTPTNPYNPATKAYADSLETNWQAVYNPQSISADVFLRSNHTGDTPAVNISQDSENRFVSDTEKAAWSAKEDAIGVKNTAFNQNYGTTAATVAAGDHLHNEYEPKNTNIQSHIATTTGNPHGVDADDLGLGDVDNTADLDKPISTATQAALDLKKDDIEITNLVTVAKAGGMFTTIQGAIDYAVATYPSRSFNAPVVIRVFPGEYREQIHSYEHIVIESAAAAYDTIHGQAKATIINTGNSTSTYPLRTASGDRYYLIGMAILTDTSDGIAGRLPEGTFKNCSFWDCHFIENTESQNAQFADCKFGSDTYGGFYVTGATLTGTRQVLLRSCKLYGTPTFTSSGHTGTPEVGIGFSADTEIIGSLTVGGDWSVEGQGLETEGVATRNLFSTSGYVKFQGGYMVNGCHFTANPLETTFQDVAFSSIVDTMIPTGEADMTATVAVTPAHVHGCSMENGLSGEIQITNSQKNVGGQQPDGYMDLQSAIDSLYDDGSIIILNENVSLAAEIVGSTYKVVIDGKGIYSITSTADPAYTLDAGEDMKFQNVAAITVPTISINGNDSEFHIVNVGSFHDKAFVGLLSIDGGNAETHIHVLKSRMVGDLAGGHCIQYNATLPITTVQRSTLVGYDGATEAVSSAVNFTVEADNAFKAKYSTFLNGNGGATDPINSIGQTCTVSIYNCAGNDALNGTGITNNITGANNTDDLQLDF